jgi:hypothetical protein
MSGGADVKFNSRGGEVKAKLQASVKAAIHALAFQAEGYCKVNITNNGQVDTGFMRSSVFTLTSDGDNTLAPSSVAGRVANPPPGLGDADAAVGVAASYAIFNEVKRPFLYPAVEQVASEAGGIVQGAFSD